MDVSGSCLCTSFYSIAERAYRNRVVGGIAFLPVLSCDSTVGLQRLSRVCVSPSRDTCILQATRSCHRPSNSKPSYIVSPSAVFPSILSLLQTGAATAANRERRLSSSS